MTRRPSELVLYFNVGDQFNPDAIDAFLRDHDLQEVQFDDNAGVDLGRIRSARGRWVVSSGADDDLPHVASNLASQQERPVVIVSPVFQYEDLGPGSATFPLLHRVLATFDEGAAGESAYDHITQTLGLEPADVDDLRELYRGFVIPQAYLEPERCFDLVLAIDKLDGVRAANFDWFTLFPHQAGPKKPKQFSDRWNMQVIRLSRPPYLRPLPAGITRETVVVAVIDEAFATPHPAIVYTGYDLHYNPTTGTHNNTTTAPGPGQNTGHGTVVAGILASMTNQMNPAGTPRVCRVMPIKPGDVLAGNPATNPSVPSPTDLLAMSIKWAADHGASVISVSWNWTVGSLDTVLLYAQNKGVVICAAAGNSKSSLGNGIYYPALLDFVLGVGAIDQAGKRKDLQSPDGETWCCLYDTTGQQELDVMAPGLQCWTADEQGTAGYNKNQGDLLQVNGVDYPVSGTQNGNYYALGHGTSIATPHVAALAALLFYAKPVAEYPTPQAARDRVIEVIRQTCLQPSHYTFTAVKNGIPWHEEVGHGIIHCDRALHGI
jgi:subtilisin family serine protease